MKKWILLPVMATCLFMVACKSGSTVSPEDKAKSDSLFKDVLKGHDVGMGKMGKLEKARNTVNHLLDSIAALPQKAQAKLEPYKVNLDSLGAALDHAKMEMENWMEQISIDTLQSDIKARIDYLSNESSKVHDVKAEILSTLDRADTLLKRTW